MGAGIPSSLRLFYDCDDEEIPAMGDGSGLAEAMLGLDGVRVTGVSEADGEVTIEVETIEVETIEVETTEPRAWCPRCGCRAESQDRMWVDVRDLECFGRPTRLRIWKRRWRCRESLCAARTWTEPLEFLDAQVVLTRRTGALRAVVSASDLARTTITTTHPNTQLPTQMRGASKSPTAMMCSARRARSTRLHGSIRPADCVMLNSSARMPLWMLR